MQARVLVQNSLFLPSASIRKFEIPHCTYTSPEVASIGPSDRELNLTEFSLMSSRWLQ